MIFYMYLSVELYNLSRDFTFGSEHRNGNLINNGTPVGL